MIKLTLDKKKRSNADNQAQNDFVCTESFFKVNFSSEIQKESQ